jgi:hypothetical protein
LAITVAVAVLIAGDVSSHAQSEQQNGQWCAYFTGGPTNCNFATFEKCLQAIKGKTALCNQNAPPASAHPRRRRRSHQD